MFDDIERRAGQAFATIGMGAIADAGAYPMRVLEEYENSARAWVDDDGQRLRGYLVLDVLGDDAHVEQVSVDPLFRGQRIGAALIDAAEAWATAALMRRSTLTTFADVPWNRPYYERLGFTVVEPPDWTPALADRVAREAEHGLDQWPRVVMAREVATSPNK